MASLASSMRCASARARSSSAGSASPWPRNGEPIAAWKVTPEHFPISGQEVAFLTSFSGLLIYVVVSLLTQPKPNWGPITAPAAR